jgi:hypothetical protein
VALQLAKIKVTFSVKDNIPRINETKKSHQT